VQTKVKEEKITCIDQLVFKFIFNDMEVGSWIHSWWKEYESGKGFLSVSEKTISEKFEDKFSNLFKII